MNGVFYAYPGESLMPAPVGYRWAPKTRPHLAEWQAYDEDDNPVPRRGSPAGRWSGKPAAFVLVAAHGLVAHAARIIRKVAS